MVEIICKIIACHLVGDYVLQQDFIAKTKGENWYHMFVHCALYSIPFAVVFGMDWRIAVIFVSHAMIDTAKARYKVLPYTADQFMHYVVAAVLYLIM